MAQTDCQPDHEFNADDLTCDACLSGETSSNGEPCTAATCNSGEVLIQEAGGLDISSTCVQRTDCEAATNLILEDEPGSGDVCRCDSNLERLTNGTSEITDDLCRDCPDGAVVTGTTCGECPAGQVEHPDGSICRLPTSNEECATAYPDESQPFYDASDTTDNCRPTVHTDCDVNYIFTNIGGNIRICALCPAHRFSAAGAGACTECPVNQIRISDSGSCVACPVENQTRIGGATSCSCNQDTHFPQDDGSCADRILASSCPGNSFVDRSENTCAECPIDQVRGDNDTCVPCDANEVRAENAAACSCEDPHIVDSGECRLPGNNEECARVGDGSAPIFDADEPTNCRAPEAGAECPTDQVFESGACTACTAPLTPNTARDMCECPAEGHAVINEMCRVLAVAPEHHTACYVADWRMPIAASTASMDCRAAADAPEDVTACQSIEPPGERNTFIAVLDGVCANNAGCTSGAGQLTPEVVRDDSERRQVGSCITGENCRGRGGLVNADLECRLPTNNTECGQVNPDTPIHHAGAARNCVAACGANERHDDNGVCECDASTNYVDIADSGEPLNCQMRCDMGEIRNTEDICEACGTNEVSNAENDACVCANDFEGSAGSCMACTGGKTSQGGADCTCPEDRLPFENSAGVCEASRAGTCTDPRNTYNSETNMCECPAGQTDTADGSACEAIADCMAPLTPNAQNECHCNPETHFGDVDSCVDHTDCPAEDEDRNPETNVCVCADGFEGEPGSCTACEGAYVSQNGAACACPSDQFDAGEGVCEASLEGMCVDPLNTYNSQTNECNCPAGQRPNADETACEAIPASSSDSGGSGGAAAALIAVPVVLIGGYWLLGGFDYIDPTYNLSYQGENDNLFYAAQGGFDLNHGNLNSYARAIQSNGDAVAYESGISYGGDLYSLDYAAYESKSIYDYDLSASLNYGDGPWSISPAADAEFNYSADSEDWTSTAGAGLTAAWTSHKWNVRAHSAFAGDLNHGLDVEFKF